MKKRLKKTAILAKPGRGFMGDVLLAMLVIISPVHAGWLVEEQKLVASGGAADDNFGRSVAISGNTAVVGAETDGEGGRDAGAAYIFVRTGDIWSHQKPNWRLQAKLIASDAASPETDFLWGDHFGQSVAITGDTVVVGALGGSSSIYSGSAYIFTRDGDSWSEQAKLTVSTPAAVKRREIGEHDQFGASVAISGDTVVIGAQSINTSNGYHAGAAFVFVRNGVTWSQQTNLTNTTLDPNDPFAGDLRFFGNSVAIYGDTIVVGEENGGDSRQGSAYIFTRNGSSWSDPTTLMVSNTAGLQEFGRSVSIFDDTVVVGNVGDNHMGSSSGSVYVFERNGDIWSEQAKLMASDAAEWDYFGGTVSAANDMIVVGARGDDGAGSESGSAYVFTRMGTHWSQQAKLMASDAAVDDGFGNSVAVSGDKVVAGGQGAYAFDLACAPNVIPTPGIPNNQWLMISLPCDPGEYNTVAEVFGDEAPGTYGTDWLMFGYANNSYVPLQSNSRLIQSEGYWILQSSGSEIFIDLPSNSTPTPVTYSVGCPTNAKGCFEIPLTTQANTVQWNLIGYPFWTAASLGNARVMTDTGVCATGCDLNTAQSQGIVQNQLWTYNGLVFDTVTTSDDLYPLMGYWAVTLDQADGTNPKLLIPKP